MQRELRSRSHIAFGLLGWSLQSFGIIAEPKSPEDIASRIQGLRIAIYSLTESSSRQAKVAIEELAPTAVVDCNADHGDKSQRAVDEAAEPIQKS